MQWDDFNLKIAIDDRLQASANELSLLFLPSAYGRLLANREYLLNVHMHIGSTLANLGWLGNIKILDL